ncbi:MAG: Ig-like domain-containing protein [Planctomycetota bacterium]|nr:MAG: Ig-like domain-containing protein [Planctomycetota bacterium]
MWKLKIPNTTVMVILTLGLTLPLLMGQGCPIPLLTGDSQNQLTAEAGPNKTTTVGSPVILQGSASGGSGVYTYVWSPPDDLNNAFTAQPTLTPTAVGTKTYTLTVADSLGSIASDTVTVDVTTSGQTIPLVANAGQDLTAAVGIPLNLLGSAAGGTPPYAYSWSPTTGLSDPNLAQPTFNPPTLGTITFTLTVTDSVGSTDDDTMEVTAFDPTTLTSLNWGNNVTSNGYQVIVVFGRELNQASAQTVTNYRISGTTINPTSATLGADLKTITLVFETPMSSATRVDLSINAGIRDSNNTIISPLTNLAINPNTNDNTPPTTTGSNWGADHADGYRIQIGFNEVLDSGTAQNLDAYRINGTTTKPNSAVLGNDGKTVTLIFKNTTLSTASTLDINVNGIIKDINGNAGAEALNQAVTVNPDDSTPPTIVEDSIQHETNFLGDGYQITVKFNEMMSKDEAENTNAYTIGGIPATTATLGNDGLTVTLNYQDPLAATDTLSVGVGNAIKDINGNSLAAANDQTINPASDDTALPFVSSAVWAANYTPDGYQIVAKFNESMDKTSTQEVTNWRISGTTTNPTTATLDNNGKIVTLNFTTIPLALNNALCVSYNNSIMDINGNIMKESPNKSIGANPADTDGPILDPATPAPVWDADNTTVYQITLTFNEAMDKWSTETLVNYQLNATGTTGWLIKNPTTATLDATGQTVTLTFEASFLDRGASINDTLSISPNVTDINGRATGTILPVAVAAGGTDITGPTLDPAAMPTWGASAPYYRVTFAFNEIMDATSAGTVFNYSLDGHDAGGGAALVNPTSADLDQTGKIITLTFETSANDNGFTLGDSINITSNVLDINGQATTSNGAYPILANPNDFTGPFMESLVWSAGPIDPITGLYYGDTKYEVVATFNEPLNASTVETLLTDYTLYTIVAGLSVGIHPTGVNLGTDGKTVTLTFDPTPTTFAIGDELTVSSSVTDINGINHDQDPFHLDPDPIPVLPNSLDSKGPMTTWLMWGADETVYKVIVTFDEVMDKTSAEELTNYVLKGNWGVDNRHPTLAVLDPTGMVVTLTFDDHTGGFTSWDDMSVSANVKDINGLLNTTTFDMWVFPNLADMNPPTVVSATRVNPAYIDIEFSEVMDKWMAEWPPYYLFTDGVLPPTPVADALLLSDGVTVRVTPVEEADPAADWIVAIPAWSVTDINGHLLAASYTSPALPPP